MPEAVAHQLVSQGVLPLCGMPEAVEAIEVAARVGKQTICNVLIPPKITASTVLSEVRAKQALTQHGLRLPKSQRADGTEMLAESARELGFPVVLKGEGVAHKTEAGAVVTGITDEQQLFAAAKAMPVDSFLVEQMITGTTVELLIGVVLDPAHGYVLTLAAGGTLTEILADSTSMILPVQSEDVRNALRKLRVAPLLDGYRGAPPANMGAIVDAVLALQSYVIAEMPFEIEINPLMCGPDGAIAADALITTGECHD
ncbi:acetate--CoA ligase family protein [Yoonia sp. GPGPB17]|uniref:acetate--CoA ligase family protein n=1 Tax=Yoonia sp. GPGPB17 TaxID=3026147 RepID=UPI0030EE2969